MNGLREGASRLRDLARTAEARGVVVALGIQGIGSLLTLAMMAIAARVMAPEEFGIFTLWFSGLSFLAVAAIFGQESILLRDWGRHVGAGDYDQARTALRLSLTVTLVLPVAAAAAVALAGVALDQEGAFIAASAAFVVLVAYLTVASFAARTLVSIQTGDVHGDITWRLVVIAVASAALVFGWPVRAADILAWAAIGMTLSVAFQVAAIRRVLIALPGRAGRHPDLPDWVRRSARLSIGSVLEGLNRYMDLFLIGLVLGPREAGVYYAASRLASVFGIIGTGMNNYATREITRFSADHQRGNLRRSLRLVSAAAAALITLGFAAILIFGKLALGVFGAAFIGGYLALVVLATGVAVTALGGPAPAVLRLTGHEALYMRLVAGLVAARAMLIVALALPFGILGAAFASAGCAIAFTVVANRACRRHVRLDPAVTNFLAPEPRLAG